MPLVAAAVCPHPPLIVPELAAGAAGELDDLRAACDEAVTHLRDAAPEVLVIVGADVRTTEYRYPFRGSFAAWGVPVEVAVGTGDSGDGPGLPLSLLVGGWLVQRAFPAADRSPAYRMIGLAADDPATRRFGDLVDGGARWALLAMGDGSACRGVKAPGYDDPRAAPYDDSVAAALAGADTGTLLDLDPELSARLRVAGRAPWQALAVAARATGGAWRGRLTYHGAPYGVGYFVATWSPA